MLATACGVQAPVEPPAETRLLTLDPLDSISPQLELIGLSTSYNAIGQRFSVEFFDLDFEHSPEVTFELDLWPDPGLQPGEPGDWDIHLECAPGRILEFTSHLPESEAIEIPVIAWDEAHDFLQVTIAHLHQLHSAPFLIRVKVREPGTQTVADVLGPVPSDARENRTAELLLVFWNSFSANTPAEALRSWDGAHSGPAGERFGLSHLLEAVQEFSLPITLLDLNSPTSLAGLEFLGHLSSVHSLQEQGLLSLPQSLPEYFSPGIQTRMLTEQIISARHEVSRAYGLLPSQWISLQDPYLSVETLTSLPHTGLSGLLSGITPLTNPASSSRVYEAAGLTILPRPRTDTAQSAGHAGGLSLDWRQALLQIALDNKPGTFIILGGSFGDTFWGDPNVVHDTFAWLNAHPWIRVLSLEKLSRSAAPSQPFDPAQDKETHAAATYDEQPSIYEPGQDPISDMALDLQARTLASRVCIGEEMPGWDDFWAKCDSELEARRDRLRAFAAPTVSMLVFASEWAQSSACSGRELTTLSTLMDTDGDGEQEAVLRSDRILAIIDPQGGRLVGLFGCKQGFPPTTIVSPRASSAIGLSDPSQWSFQHGEIGEWAEPFLNGGFVFPRDAGMTFDLEQTQEGVQVTHPDGDYQIHYTLHHDKLRVTLNGYTRGSRSIELPFSLAPERLLQPGFMLDYQLDRGPDGFRLGLNSRLQLDVLVSASAWQVDSFLDSPAPTMKAEDPNLEAPPGHYLPFPFTLLTFTLDDYAKSSIVLKIQ